MKRGIWIAGTWVALATATILAACGGGSSGSSGTSASGMAGASGVITGFGSVFVNGKEFKTDMSTRVLDGDNDDAASSTASLQVGMTVDVDADSGKATMLRFTSAVRGQVDAVDDMASTLTVLGQKVRITTATSFAGNVGSSPAASTPVQLANLLNKYVVVYGFLECTGAGGCPGPTEIVATLVSEPASVGKYRVQGYVTGAGASSNSFTINGLTVNLVTSGASPTVCNTMNCTFKDGDFVSVRSTMAPSGSTLTADEVKLRSEAPTFAASTTVTIEGPVTKLSGTSFVVRGISVDASKIASSVLSSLADNQIVEVTGTISSDSASFGTLVATSIAVEQHATFVLMGPVDSMPPPTSSTFSVLGQTFTVTAETRFGDLALDERPFNSTNLSTVLKAGDQVVVAGYPSGTGDVATRVERIATPKSPQAAVAGVVSADSISGDKTTGTMTIAGIAVTLSSSTKLFYPGAGSMPTLAGFIAAITPNKTVGAAFGAPGSMAGTITAADAAALPFNTHWED